LRRRCVTLMLLEPITALKFVSGNTFPICP
jgi:hypothetical protein